MQNSRTKNTVLNTLTGFLVKIVTILTSFISRTIFIKVLGIQYAGVSGVFTDILTILSFAELGIGSAITFALYKPIAERNERQIAKLMYAYKKIYIIIATVVFVLGLSLIPFLDHLVRDIPDVHDDLRLIFFLYVLNSAVSYLLVYKATFLTAAQKDYLVSKIKIYFQLVKVIAECVILLVFRDFITYLIFTVASVILLNYIIARYAEKKYPVLKEKSSEQLSRNEKRTLFKNVRALFMYKVSGVVLNGTDSVVISSILGTPLVGILANYNLVTKQLYAIVLQIFSSTAASIGNLAATSTNEHQYLVFRKLNLLCLWIYCVSATCLWVLLNPFITIWLGEEYLFAPLIVGLLISDYYITGMLSPITQFRTSNGLFVQGQFRPVIMAVLNIGISIFLAYKIGIAGVIIGTLLSRALTQLWYDPWLVYRSVFKMNVLKYYAEYLLNLFMVAISCVISQYLYSLWNGNQYIGLGWGLLCAFIVSNIVVLAVYAKTKGFEALIQHLRLIILAAKNK